MNISMKTVDMASGKQAIRLECIYNPHLPPKLRAMGGKWNGDQKVWYLPTSTEAEVRRLMVEVFGIDPMGIEEDANLVNVELDISGMSMDVDTLWFFGRPMLRRFAWDKPVKPGEGVNYIGERGSCFSPTSGTPDEPTIGRVGEDVRLFVTGVPLKFAESVGTIFPALKLAVVGVYTAEEETKPKARKGKWKPPAKPKIHPPEPEVSDYNAAMVMANALGAVLKNLNADEQSAVLEVLLRD